MAKAFFITLLLFVGIGVFLIFRTGYLKEVQISSGEQGPFVMIYREHRGSYHKIAGVLDQVEDQLRDLGFPCPLAFGRYLDDPDLVEEDRLTSHGGCLYPIPNPEREKVLLNQGFRREVLEKKEYLVATFTGSPSLGPLRVYPKVKAWLEKYGYKKEGPVIEIYQTLGADAVSTRYLFGYK